MLSLYYAALPSLDNPAQSAAVRLLLDGALRDLGYPAAALKKTPQGKPFLPDLPCLDVSLAHTKHLAVCALLFSSDGTARVGVDAESLSAQGGRDPAAFAKRFFAEHEHRYLLTATDRQRAFLTVFTQKEAYGKFLGTGLVGKLRDTDTMAPDFGARHGVCLHTTELCAHLVTLCLPSGTPPTPTVKLLCL